MKAFQMIRKDLKALYKDEQGADMVEYILIIAALGLPLLGFIVYFWGEIKEWALNLWNQITGDAEDQMQI